MEVPLSFEGVIVPVVTPFSLEGALDPEGLEAQLGWLSGKGLAGIVALGSTGEAVLVSREERRLVIEICASLKEEGTVLVAGTGAESTADSIALARDAAELGADALLVVTPSYYRAQMTSRALCDHYVAVADDSPVPLLLYNMPESTGIHLPSEAAEELSAHPNIAGLKDSSGDLRSLHLFLGCTPPDFRVLTGSTLILGASAGAGAVGAILAMGNVAPELCVELFEAGRTGDMDRVLGLQPQLGFLTRAIQGAYGIPGIKAAVDLLGGRGGAVRSPLQPLTDEDRAAVAAALEEGGLTHRQPRAGA